MLGFQPAVVSMTAFCGATNLNHDLQGAMASVAHHAVLGVLATAEIRRAGLFSLVFLGRKFRTLMRAIAKWLGYALAARTPPIALACFNFDGVGGFLGDYGGGHGDLLEVNLHFLFWGKMPKLQEPFCARLTE